MRRAERNAQIAAERMEQIRAAARRVFAEHGYHGATTDQIARAAGVSPGLIFHYFKSKKELLVEVVTPLAVESLTRFLSDAGGLSPDEVLYRFLQGHGEFMRANLDLLRVIFSEAQFHPEVRELVISRLLHQGTRVLEEYFRRQAEAGALRADLDAPVVARALIGLFLSVVVLREIFQEPVMQSRDVGSLNQQLVQIFLDGVRAR